MNVPFSAPELNKSAFNCPFCGAYANQAWGKVHRGGGGAVVNLSVAYCTHCTKYSTWYGDAMIHPYHTIAPIPNQDTPVEIQEDYSEARDIVSRSPRGAAALLRLCIQKLCLHLGESGKDINNDIASMVSKGLPVTVQQALDVVRVVGNESVHPGELDLRDNMETALALFHLFNLIVDNRISEPKRVKAIYDSLPKTKLEGIEKRDAASKKSQ